MHCEVQTKSKKKIKKNFQPHDKQWRACHQLATHYHVMLFSLLRLLFVLIIVRTHSIHSFVTIVVFVVVVVVVMALICIYFRFFSFLNVYNFFFIIPLLKLLYSRNIDERKKIHIPSILCTYFSFPMPFSKFRSMAIAINTTFIQYFI